MKNLTKSPLFDEKTDETGYSEGLGEDFKYYCLLLRLTFSKEFLYKQCHSLAFQKVKNPVAMTLLLIGLHFKLRKAE